MTQSNFMQMLDERWKSDLMVCVGLDSAVSSLPRVSLEQANPQLWFNRAIVDATIDATCAYKLNLAFYLERPELGLDALRATIAYIHASDVRVPVILDAKFGDIGNTNEAYARFAFDELTADAVTVSPYVGGEALAPFLDYKNKGIFVLSRTSNRGSEELQGNGGVPKIGDASGTVPMYEVVAGAVARDWNGNQNCGLVVGATTPLELERCRWLVGDMPILVPGVGAQGGDLASTVSAGLGRRRDAMLINVSRSLIFASGDVDFGYAARGVLDELNMTIDQLKKTFEASSE